MLISDTNYFSLNLKRFSVVFKVQTNYHFFQCFYTFKSNRVDNFVNLNLDFSQTPFHSP